jgi:uncharacterized protein (DUF4415 family)
MIDDKKLPNIQLVDEGSKLPPIEAPVEKIDYSEIPELNDAWLQKAKRATQLPEKKQISLRIDVDILDFFKQQGSRYQTKMHAVLRAYVDGSK